MTDVSNVQQTMITGKCEVCGVDIAPAKTEGIFKRNRGLHMFMSHGVAGKWRQQRLAKKARNEVLHGAKPFSSSSSMYSKGTPEQRRAWAKHCVSVKLARQQANAMVPAPKLEKGQWSHSQYSQEDIDLGQMEVTDPRFGTLTDDQRRIRYNVRKSVVFKRIMAAREAGVPESIQNQFTAQELALLRPMEIPEARALSPEQKQERIALQKRVYARVYYAQNKEHILSRERLRNQRMRQERNGESEVTTDAPVVPVPSVESAMPCKLAECPACGTRFYMVKGQTHEKTE
jgi:hypothetical protein